MREVLAELRGRLDPAALEAQFPVLGKAKAGARQLALRSVEVATRVYDPSPPPRLARLGPDEGPPDRDRHARLDDALASGAWPGLALREVGNERVVRGRFGFDYQPWGEPRLEELRRRHGLDAVVEGAADELEAMVRLRSWTRSRFRRTDWQPRLDTFDALTVLERDCRNADDRPNDKSVNYTPCSFFPPFYVQVMLSMGYQTRYVSISHEGSDFHGLTEVWSNQHRKWVTMDADLNLLYLRDGVPLSLLEVHDLRYAPDPLRFEMVRTRQDSGDGLWQQPLPGGGNDFFVSYHSYFRVEMRNDCMTNRYFRGHPKRSDKVTLYYRDGRLPPPRTPSPTTSRREDLYWTLNQAEVLLPVNGGGASGRRLPLVFDTVTPDFDFFEVTVDDGEPLSSATSRFSWDLHDGDNRLVVLPVNAAGVRGVPSRIVVAAS